jgi:hypothetical protein
MVNSAGCTASVQSGKGSGGRGPERVAAAPAPGDVRMEVVEEGHPSHGLEMDTAVKFGHPAVGGKQATGLPSAWKGHLGFPTTNVCRFFP